VAHLVGAVDALQKQLAAVAASLNAMTAAAKAAEERVGTLENKVSALEVRRAEGASGGVDVSALLPPAPFINRSWTFAGTGPDPLGFPDGASRSRWTWNPEASLVALGPQGIDPAKIVEFMLSVSSWAADHEKKIWVLPARVICT
jgi:hypothetical protein